MGEISEARYQDMYTDPPDDYEATPPALRTPTGYWTTRNGRTLKTTDMTSEHIANIIRLYERAGWAGHPKLEELRHELRSRR